MFYLFICRGEKSEDFELAVVVAGGGGSGGCSFVGLWWWLFEGLIERRRVEGDVKSLRGEIKNYWGNYIS